MNMSRDSESLLKLFKDKLGEEYADQGEARSKSVELFSFYAALERAGYSFVESICPKPVFKNSIEKLVEIGFSLSELQNLSGRVIPDAKSFDLVFYDDDDREYHA